MRKFVSLFLSLLLILMIMPMGIFTASAATSGTTGDCTWTLDGTVLTISGEGKMWDYYSTVPWGTSITKVIIEDGVTSIGDYAFYNCSSLTSIDIPDSVTSIGGYAFSYCSSLKNVYITDIGAWCNIKFGDYYSNPMCYAENLYLNNKLLTKATIPEGITKIGDYAFSNCSSLISIDIPDSVTSIGDYTFYNCSSLTNINIPNSVTSIGHSAFSYCRSLTSIEIPDGVTSIGDYTFHNCSSLTSINIPDSVKSIGDDTFEGCSSLIIIEIPDGVTSIGEHAFSYCSSLISIDIPDSVTSIGWHAFFYCSSLTSINIPDSVTSIGDSAFNYCYSLENVYITDIEAWCKIGFEDNSSNPMYYAENLYVNNQLLTDVKIPDNTEIINSYNFYNCKSIESVFIPKSMILIKQDAFYNCSGIKNVYYEGTAEEWAEVTVLSGNDYLKNATVYYNSTGIPGGVASVEISILPQKVQYIENEEELDLTGGVLTVNYEGGATQDIDLATLNAEGFDNTVLGKQTLTVKYGEFSAEFEVEVISRPIFLMAVLNSPIKTEYVSGESLNLTGGKIAVVYPEGNYETFDITADMVSGFDGKKTGTQILTVTYKGYTDELIVCVFLNGDSDGDGNINISDLAVMRNGFIESDGNMNDRWDVTGDGKVDALDLVRLKKYVAGLKVELL